MPTVLRSGPYRLFFYSGDRDEPPHVHVERDDEIAKVWLDPVRMERNAGFRAADLKKILQIVEDNQGKLMEAWHDYFQG